MFFFADFQIISNFAPDFQWKSAVARKGDAFWTGVNDILERRLFDALFRTTWNFANSYE